MVNTLRELKITNILADDRIKTEAMAKPKPIHLAPFMSL